MMAFICSRRWPKARELGPGVLHFARMLQGCLGGGAAPCSLSGLVELGNRRSPRLGLKLGLVAYSAFEALVEGSTIVLRGSLAKARAGRLWARRLGRGVAMCNRQNNTIPTLYFGGGRTAWAASGLICIRVVEGGRRQPWGPRCRCGGKSLQSNPFDRVAGSGRSV